MKPLHFPGLTSLLVVCFLFFAPYFLFAQPDTIRQLTKVGEDFTLDLPGVTPSAAFLFKWVRPQADTTALSPSPLLEITPVDSASTGVYELIQVPVLDLSMGSTLGYIKLDSLCSSNVNENIGCFVCNEIVVEYNNPAVQSGIEAFFMSLGLEPVKTCKCDSIILYRADGIIINLEEAIDDAENMVEVEDANFGLNFVINTGPASREQILSIEGGETIILNPIQIPSGCDEDVQVAIIDAGIQRNHSSFLSGSGRFWMNTEEIVDEALDSDGNCLDKDFVGFDFLNNVGGDFLYVDGHGTHVGGIIANEAVPGVIELMDLKFYEPENATLFDAVCAMHYAIDKEVEVMNLSWGFTSELPSQLLVSALTRAMNNQVIVVTSAGNEMMDNDMYPHWPSNHTTEYSNMIAVAAVTQVLGSSPPVYTFAEEYSNFGMNTVDVAAPGTFIRSAYPDDILQIESGTSMAAAFVSQLAAHGRSCRPDLSADAIVGCILDGINLNMNVNPPIDNLIINNGIIDYDAAINCILALPTSTEDLALVDQLEVFPKPFHDILFIDLSDYPFDSGILSLYHSSGQLATKKNIISGSTTDLNLSYLPTGLYLYTLRLQDKYFTGKVIKQ